MEITLIPYVAGGVALGLIFGELVRPIRAVHIVTGLLAGMKRALPEKPTQIVDDSTIIKCAACQSIIMSKPIMRTVAAGKDTLIYQCHQCGTQVAVLTGV